MIFKIVRAPYDDRRGFLHLECARKCTIPLHQDNKGPNSKTWQWNGSEEAATIAQSIRCTYEDCRFHGTLTNGIMSNA